jgi:hypothetical protein
MMVALFGSLATVILGVAATIGFPAEQKAPRLSEQLAEAMNLTWWGVALGMPALVLALVSFVVMARSRPPPPLRQPRAARSASSVGSSGLALAGFDNSAASGAGTSTGSPMSGSTIVSNFAGCAVAATSRGPV